MKKISIFLFIFLFFHQLSLISQDDQSFTMIKQIPTTSIKNQFRSNTCWSFTGIAFLESELIRMGKGEYDLSEMYIIRQTFINKALKYVRMHGNLTFGGGGEFNDVLDIISSNGILPEEAYIGKIMGEKQHIHGEMNEVLKNYVDAIVKNKNDKLTTVWDEGFELVLNAYLGNVPPKFNYKGKEYTPESFYKSLELDLSKYIYISSFTHHPYYNKFTLEVPDNWSWGEYYNVPLNELKEIVDNAINKGYTVGLAVDVTEDGFSWEQGMAVLNKDSEKSVSPQFRQLAFDNYETQDDHGMLIVGFAKDKENKKYYYMKNSWGSDNAYKGFVYMSEDYFLYKAMYIMVNKEVVPENILKKFHE